MPLYNRRAARIEGCDDTCPGWFVDNERFDVTRCDDCAVFADDDEAAAHVLSALIQRPTVLALVEDRYGRESRAIKSHRAKRRA